MKKMIPILAVAVLAGCSEPEQMKWPQKPQRTADVSEIRVDVIDIQPSDPIGRMNREYIPESQRDWVYGSQHKFYPLQQAERFAAKNPIGTHCPTCGKANEGFDVPTPKEPSRE